MRKICFCSRFFGFLPLGKKPVNFKLNEGPAGIVNFLFLFFFNFEKRRFHLVAESFTILESKNIVINFSEQHKVRRSPNFEALKSQNVPSGSGKAKFVFCFWQEVRLIKTAAATAAVKKLNRKEVAVQNVGWVGEGFSPFPTLN